MELTKTIYSFTNEFPKNETYGIISQMRRSALSIPSNIAEGTGRNSDKELNKFLNIALGSSFELETQIILSYELDMINNQQFKNLDSKISELQKMIIGFKNKIKE